MKYALNKKEVTNIVMQRHFKVDHKVLTDSHYPAGLMDVMQIRAKGAPVIITHERSTIRYPNPSIRENDTIRFNLKSGKIEDFAKFEIGNLCIASGGRNMERIGTIVHSIRQETRLGFLFLVTND